MSEIEVATQPKVTIRFWLDVDMNKTAEVPPQIQALLREFGEVADEIRFEINASGTQMRKAHTVAAPRREHTIGEFGEDSYHKLSTVGGPVGHWQALNCLTFGDSEDATLQRIVSIHDRHGLRAYLISTGGASPLRGYAYVDRSGLWKLWLATDQAAMPVFTSFYRAASGDIYINGFSVRPHRALRVFHGLQILVSMHQERAQAYAKSSLGQQFMHSRHVYPVLVGLTLSDIRGELEHLGFDIARFDNRDADLNSVAY